MFGFQSFRPLSGTNPPESVTSFVTWTANLRARAVGMGCAS